MTSNDIAVVGLAFQLPGGIDTEDAFWDVVEKGRRCASDIPSERINVKGLGTTHAQLDDQLPTKGGHFRGDDISAFDAPFFRMTPAEATGVDPSQRKLLETSYHALENAGYSIDRVAGTRTSVHVGSFGADYAALQIRDPLYPSKHAATGVAAAFQANRISWFFDLRGPSFQLDSACSSSLTALDLSCKALIHGESSMGIVGGCSLFFDPFMAVSLANAGALSPKGVSHSFDSRANGYGRGEGFAVLVLKRVEDAVSDGDTIRAVIRSIHSNQDGRTGVMTQPSADAQEKLIREAYANANLEMHETAYFEAHATGTAVGDPIEAEAVQRAFAGRGRVNGVPLSMGSLKANLGHLEGASGVASVIKVVLMLERGRIPPIADLLDLNPRLEQFNDGTLEFPRECSLWPDFGVRRASINSFGLGGSNCHVVLDDAATFLERHGLRGRHNTLVDRPTSIDTLPLEQICLKSREDTSKRPRLMLLSASDQEGMTQLTSVYEEYWKAKDDQHTIHDQFLDDLCYTLSLKRSLLAWRAFAVVNAADDVKHSNITWSAPRRAGPAPGLCLVFTGQGAQWAGMGVDLWTNPLFRKSLESSSHLLTALGCPWNLFDEISRASEHSHIDEPALSQPTCTALQVAIVDALERAGVSASAVVGHSSGEIAAAYCAKHISKESALKIAYYRGLVSASLSSWPQSSGAMLAVSMSEVEAKSLILSMFPENTSSANVACINSPDSVTLSGKRESIDQIESHLNSKNIFARRLRVNVGYHSSQMLAVADLYKQLLHDLDRRECASNAAVMISSVTGLQVKAEETSTADYWVSNLTSPVLFSCALTAAMNHIETKGASPSHFVEVGPHSALSSAVRSTWAASGATESQYAYTSVMTRKKSALSTFLAAIGTMHSWGAVSDMARVLELQNIKTSACQTLVDLPRYPFNHGQSYWHEGPMSRGYRLRSYPRHEVLGAPVADWNPLQPKWRNILKLSELPWVDDHKVCGKRILPGAAMVTMAFEAAYQMHEDNLQRLELTDVSFDQAIAVEEDPGYVETNFFLLPNEQRTSRHISTYKFTLSSRTVEGSWAENCSGVLQAHLSQSEADCSIARIGNLLSALPPNDNCLEPLSLSVDGAPLYASLAAAGLDYGPSFQLLSNVSASEDGHARALLSALRHALPAGVRTPFLDPIHPAALDSLFHLTFVALSRGGRTAIPTAVPTRISRLQLSLANRSTNRHEYPAIARWTNFKDSSIIAFNGDGSKPYLQIDGLETTVIGEGRAPEDAASRTTTAYRRVIREDIDMLHPEELANRCRVSPCDSPEPMEEANDVHKAVISAMRYSVNALENDDAKIPKTHLRKYAAWMRTVIGHDSTVKQYDDIEPTIGHELLDKLTYSGPVTKLYREVCLNLPKILSGEVDPHSLLFSTTLAKDYYAELGARARYVSASAELIGLLAHKTPGMRVLEIGAGTGAATSTLMPAFRKATHGLPGASFSQWDYTDLSAAFFDSARETFVDDVSRMAFKLLDIEADIEPQQFEAGSYDLIIAGSVLHATKDVRHSLRNARKLLRPGGKMILIEVTETDKIAIPFVWGLFEGWWLSTDGRDMSPILNTSEWAEALKGTGFSGVDLCLPDFESSECREVSVMLTTAVGESKGELFGVKVVIDAEQRCQQEAASELAQSPLLAHGSHKVDILTLEEVVTSRCKASDVYVSLLELGDDMLADMGERHFDLIKQLLLNTRRLLWASNPTNADQDARGSIILGLSRVLRSENAQLDLRTLVSSQRGISNVTANIEKIVMSMLSSTRQSSSEAEYVVTDRALSVPRVFQDPSLSTQIATGRKVTDASRMRFSDAGYPLEMRFATAGLLDSIDFRKDRTSKSALADHDVEIQVKAVGLNFLDTLTALGKIERDNIGFEAAGIVTRADNKSPFKPGDRVCGFWRGAFRTLTRGSEASAFKLSDNISFSTAAALPVALGTAYHALYNVARVRTGESILIHAAAGGTGQAAIQVAQHFGLTIYATVGTIEKRQFLTSQYRIPEEHILDSRSTSFATGVMQLTGGRGVDVVFNSLSGESLIASWECVAPFGRFLEIGKSDILSRSELPMYRFRENVSFCAIDLAHVAEAQPALLGQCFQDVMALVSKGVLGPSKPVQEYSISNVEDAFRHMQSGKSMGKLVITIGDEDMVQVQTPPKNKCSLRPDATYMIAGAFGGVGRALAIWMAKRGARNLLLVSRSGPVSSEAQHLLVDLQQHGVHAQTPKCDIGDMTGLQDTINSCASTMPPIKGCVQASVILQDAIFDNMTHEQWQAALYPKVKGSWNLHKLLPGDLDFLVMLSSACGAFGNYSQANYAAANTYQNALAEQRRGMGLPSFALDLSLIYDMDSTAATPDAIKRLMAGGQIVPMTTKQLLALMDVYCDTSADSNALEKVQPIIGVETPQRILEAGHDLPPYFNEPAWASLWHLGTGQSQTAAKEGQEDIRSTLQSAQTSSEAHEIIFAAMKSKLSRSLAVAEAEVDQQQPLTAYGVDSLMAVEVRNWIGKELDADISVFELLSGNTLGQLVVLIAHKSDLCKASSGI